MIMAAITDAANTVRNAQCMKCLSSFHDFRADSAATSRTASPSTPRKVTVATTVAVEMATATMP